MSTQAMKQILGKVRRLEISTRQLVSGPLSGRYGSVFKGQGMQFDEVREYVPGDDVRAIDWNVTAREGKPFVKKFTEERELTILIAVDVSASGDFGSGRHSKREVAAELASVLAFSASQNQDKVGLLLFTDTTELYLPPSKGRNHAMRIIRDILAFKPRGRSTSVSSALDYIDRIGTRRAVVFVISDFQSGETLPELKRALELTRRHNDVVAVHISDPHESTLPNVGVLAIEDAEMGEIVELDTSSEKIREDYRTLADKRVQEIRQTLNRAHVDMLELSTARPYLPALLQFFKTRTRRKTS